MTTNLLLVYKMEKRDRPLKGFYKSLEGPVDFLVDRSRCQKKPNILGVFQAERVVAKKIRNGKPMFKAHWRDNCTSENTWEPKAHLPAEMIEAFENPDPDPVRVQQARERIGLVFERGLKVPLQYEESIEIRHYVVRFLFPNLPAALQLTPTHVSDQELEEAGLSAYTERQVSANGNRCRVVQLTFRLLLSSSPSFYNDGKKTPRPEERLRIIFRKKYLA